MKPMSRVSLSLLCAALYGAATLAQGAEGAFYQCAPSSYEEAGLKLDCLGADKANESCEVFELTLAELTESGGSYRHAESSEKDGRRFINEVMIVRATGAFTETETLAGVQVGKTVGICILKKG